jgi:hypothetical protein
MRSFDPPRPASADRQPAKRTRRPISGPRPAQAPRRPAAESGVRREALAAAPRAAHALPERLRTVMEAMSGFSLADVVVHRNSAEPARLGAEAFTKGNQIHLGPGQERHLPHEAWHVVQQAQGRVSPTLQMKGVGINDDDALEREADEKGREALAAPIQRFVPPAADGRHAPVVQRLRRKVGNAWRTIPVRLTKRFRARHVATTHEQAAACALLRKEDEHQLIQNNTTAAEAVYTALFTASNADVGEFSSYYFTTDIACTDTSMTETFPVNIVGNQVQPAAVINYTHVDHTARKTVSADLVADNRPNPNASGWIVMINHVGAG